VIQAWYPAKDAARDHGGKPASPRPPTCTAISTPVTWIATPTASTAAADQAGTAKTRPDEPDQDESGKGPSLDLGTCWRTWRSELTGLSPSLLIRRQCRACQQPGHLAAGLPGWFALACVVFPCCAALYGQFQASSDGGDGSQGPASWQQAANEAARTYLRRAPERSRRGR
jgi:hypothetical protein